MHQIEYKRKPIGDERTRLTTLAIGRNQRDAYRLAGGLYLVFRTSGDWHYSEVDNMDLDELLTGLRAYQAGQDAVYLLDWCELVGIEIKIIERDGKNGLHFNYNGFPIKEAQRTDLKRCKQGILDLLSSRPPWDDHTAKDLESQLIARVESSKPELYDGPADDFVIACRTILADHLAAIQWAKQTRRFDAYERRVKATLSWLASMSTRYAESHGLMMFEAA